ncbi:MAG: sulfotransferase, partial [Pricia sp.]
SSMQRNNPIKLIYVAGYGRSGTTLLDIAIGQQDGVFAAGEVTALPRHVWANDEFCACRKTVSECEFWGPVVRRWQEGRDNDAMPVFGNLLARTEYLFSPARFLSRFRSSRQYQSFGEQTGALFEQIAQSSGANVIVDSSKLPGRAASMLSMPGVEIYLVHVVRDGRGVAWSMMKPYSVQVEAGIQKELKAKPLWFTAARWLMVNLATEILRLRLPRDRSIRVRYEDFVADPEATVKRIMALACREYVRPAHGGEVMRPQHQVAGSRHRMQDEIRIKKDVGWKAKMPRAKQAAFSILAAPLLWRYGYFRKSDDDRLHSNSDDHSMTEKPA